MNMQPEIERDAIYAGGYQIPIYHLLEVPVPDHNKEFINFEKNVASNNAMDSYELMRNKRKRL